MDRGVKSGKIRLYSASPKLIIRLPGIMERQIGGEK